MPEMRECKGRNRDGYQQAMGITDVAGRSVEYACKLASSDKDSDNEELEEALNLVLAALDQFHKAVYRASHRGHAE